MRTLPSLAVLLAVAVVGSAGDDKKADDTLAAAKMRKLLDTKIAV